MASQSVICEICGKVTNRIGIVGHWKWHVEKEDVEGSLCYTCGRLFPSTEVLDKHFAEDHKGSPARRTEPRRERYEEVERWARTMPYRQFVAKLLETSPVKSRGSTGATGAR